MMGRKFYHLKKTGRVIVASFLILAIVFSIWRSIAQSPTGESGTGGEGAEGGTPPTAIAKTHNAPLQQGNNNYTVSYNTPNLFIQAGFHPNQDSRFAQFPQPFVHPPIVVISRNFNATAGFGWDEQAPRVYDITTTGFKYQGDGDDHNKDCGPSGNQPCGIWWIAVDGDLRTISKTILLDAGNIKAGFEPNDGTNPHRVSFPSGFTTTPIVVASRNWFAQNEDQLKVYGIDKTGFTYGGDAVTWMTNDGYQAGVYWVAINGSIPGILETGFNDNTQNSSGDYATVQLGFASSTNTPIVAMSKNWIMNDENSDIIRQINKTSFEYYTPWWSKGSGQGIYWIAINPDKYFWDGTSPVPYETSPLVSDSSINQIVQGVKIQSGFYSNRPNTSPQNVSFTPGFFDSPPIVVASRNWFAQNEEMIRVYGITKDSFSYQGDGDTWVHVGGYPAGIYWIAIQGQLTNPISGCGIQAGFYPNPGVSPVTVDFSWDFKDSPVVVASRNWFDKDANVEMIRVYDIDRTGFKYQGDGDTWITNNGYRAGIYWIAASKNINECTQGRLQANFNPNNGVSPVQATFNSPFSDVLNDPLPIAVASRNWFAQNEEMIRVYGITKDSFSYQGDGDTWTTTPDTNTNNKAGVYWLAVLPDTGFKIVDKLPDFVTYVSGASPPPSLTLNNGNTQSLIWNDPRSFGFGKSNIIQPTVLIPPQLCGNTITNTATLYFGYGSVLFRLGQTSDASSVQCGITISGDIFANTLNYLGRGGDIVAKTTPGVPVFGDWKIGNYTIAPNWANVKTKVTQTKEKLKIYNKGCNPNPINQLSVAASPPEGEIYYCIGADNPIFAAQYNGKGTFIIDHNLIIASNIDYAAGSNGPLGVIVNGNITITNSVTNLVGAYFATGNITFPSSSNFTFNGLAAGSIITLPTAGNFSYDPRISTNPPPGFREIFKALYEEAAP